MLFLSKVPLEGFIDIECVREQTNLEPIITKFEKPVLKPYHKFYHQI